MGSNKVTMIALEALMKVVRQINVKVNTGNMAADYRIKLSNKSNSYLTKFVTEWVKTDEQANFFIFKLGGFEFLLDFIGRKGAKKSKNVDKQELVQELAGLDISDLGEIIPLFE
jgi:hypothetical protein